MSRDVRQTGRRNHLTLDEWELRRKLGIRDEEKAETTADVCLPWLG